MKKALGLASATALLVAFVGLSFARSGNGVSGGVILLNDPSARAMALSGAIGASIDDVSSFAYNPASLSSLKRHQATLLHEAGMIGDTYNQLMIGTTLPDGGLGCSVAYYQGGHFDFSDGIVRKDVTAQKDFVFSLGYGYQIGSLAAGVSGKYLSSELVETYKGDAYAFDFGMVSHLTPQLRLGASLQNIGTDLAYISDGDPLPKLARLSLSYLLLVKNQTLNLLFDAPYRLNEHRLDRAVGLETKAGPLALRMGYRSGIDFGEVTAGLGITFGQASLDYAFGMVESLSSKHRISVSLRFGEKRDENKNPLTTMFRKKAKNKTYDIKPGDTLAKISLRMYGDLGWEQRIYEKNKRVMSGEKSLPAGQRISLP
ncbi:MAG: PorV/PorQ family protein [Elusimicrobia bacterium]|nr:PorV/PorQ family protein [Candidatus Obscuribacterium magneticum]